MRTNYHLCVHIDNCLKSLNSGHNIFDGSIEDAKRDLIAAKNKGRTFYISDDVCSNQSLDGKCLGHAVPLDATELYALAWQGGRNNESVDDQFFKELQRSIDALYTGRIMSDPNYNSLIHSGFRIALAEIKKALGLIKDDPNE